MTVYPLTPLKIYMLERVQDDARCVARMERMLGAMGKDRSDVVCITEANLPDVVAELQQLWPPDEVPAGCVRSYMRPIVFTTMDLSANRPDLGPLLAACPEGTAPGPLANIYGHMETAIDQHPHGRDRETNCVCWPTINFGTAVGCPHGCLYCGQGRDGKFLALALNLEDYMARIVAPMIEFNPWNRVFRMILNGTDLMTFEPEYGLFELFAATLARYEDRYGHFHTGSSNVEWLAEMPHRDRLVGVWSTTCEAVAREIEPGSGAAVDRFEAGRKCQEMGIPVRYKFKPIIPVRNWREEYASAIKEALTRSKPESIGFCLFIWHDFDAMAAKLGLEMLDPDFVDAARNAQEEMKGKRQAPFPHNKRAEVYRFMIKEARRWSKDVLLYVSTESREMWDELADELGQDPRRYVCACSSVAVPGGRLALNPGLRFSTYHPTPV